jgi:uncharacterized protein with PIN domain
VTAAEIRAKSDQFQTAMERIAKRDGHLDLSALVVTLYVAHMEIAAQIAELNERERMRPDLRDNPKLFCPDCNTDLGRFYSNRLRMVRDGGGQ